MGHVYPDIQCGKTDIFVSWLSAESGRLISPWMWANGEESCWFSSLSCMWHTRRWEFLPKVQILSGCSFFCQHVWSDAGMNKRESWSWDGATSALQRDTHTSRLYLQKLGRTIKLAGTWKPHALLLSFYPASLGSGLVCPPIVLNTGTLVFDTPTHTKNHLLHSVLAGFPMFSPAVFVEWGCEVIIRLFSETGEHLIPAESLGLLQRLTTI